MKGYELLGDQRVNEGGHLVLRRLRVRLIRDDGSKTREGSWDYVERPMGLDAVVVALWHRGARGAEVLLRAGPRVAVSFGRPAAEQRALLFPELVAGIVEPGEDSEPKLQQRCADEALEEAGLTLPPQGFQRLGAPMFPTPGMCPELFHFFHAEVTAEQRARAARPQGDGSPFEEGATLEWLLLDEALQRCARGELQDLKTELALRRLHALS